MFWLIPLPALWAQNKYVDSLQGLLTVHLDVIKRIHVEQQLADWYRANEQYSEALKMAEKSLVSALELSPNSLEVTKAYWILSNIYTNTEDFEKSREYIDKAYGVANKSDNVLSLAYASYASAVLYSTLFDTERTVKLLHQALTQIPDREHEAALTARIYYLLYGIYTEWNDERQALNYANNALRFSLKSGNRNIAANVYSAFSVIYSYGYEKTRRKESLDSIMSSLDKAIALHDNYPGEVVANTYAQLLNNKASYYLKYYAIADPVIKKKIRENVTAALKVVPSTNDVIIASCYGILSELSMQESDLVSAENYLTKAYIMIIQKKKPYYHTLINVLNSLVSLNVKKGDFRKGLEYQQKVTEYSNLLFDEEASATTNRLEAQFELKKKEQEIKNLQETAENRQKQKYLLIGIIGVGLLGGFFMFRSYHFRLRYSLTREKQLASEKNEADLKIKYQEEERARLKAEQELMELQQQKLHNEMLASELQLQHKSKVLKQVKENLSGAETKNLRQILREEQMTDTDFEKTKFRIQEVHPNFFKHLQEHSKQKLSPLDQKYCAYFYLDMDTKQIAHQLNVEPKSVRMTKYRLKQKFGLNSETDLVSYLKNIGL